jgi:hypothetical protein
MLPAPPCARRSPGSNGPGCHVPSEAIWSSSQRAGGAAAAVAASAALRRWRSASESAAGSVPGVLHAHARARWTGRTPRVEIEGWVDPGLPARDADALGRQVAAALARQLPEAGSLT